MKRTVGRGNTAVPAAGIWGIRLSKALLPRQPIEEAELPNLERYKILNFTNAVKLDEVFWTHSVRLYVLLRESGDFIMKRNKFNYR